MLFVIQRLGHRGGRQAFGPVMVLWFAVLAVLGLPHIFANPEILAAISPDVCVDVRRRSIRCVAFVAMGGVVLTITGAEALYADMGHFGAQAHPRSRGTSSSSLRSRSTTSGRAR